MLAAAASASSSNPDDPSAPAQPSFSTALEAEAAAILARGPVIDDVEIDERPWPVPTRSPIPASGTVPIPSTSYSVPAPHHTSSSTTDTSIDPTTETREITTPSGKTRKVLVKRLERKRGLDMGCKDADECMHWMNRKVLEHEGFQGSSAMALNVLSGIAGEFLMNVGRTLRFYLDRYSGGMTPEVCGIVSCLCSCFVFFFLSV